MIQKFLPKLELILVLTIITYVMFSANLIINRDFHNDEAYRVELAKQPTKTIITKETHPPIYPLLIKTFQSYNIYLLRTASVLITILTGIIVTLISIRMNINPVITTILFFSSTQTIYYSTYASMYSLAMLLAATNFYFYLEKDTRKTLISGILMSYTHLFTLFNTLSQTILSVAKKQKKMLATLAATLIVAAPAIIHAYSLRQYQNWITPITTKKILFALTAFSGSITTLTIFAFLSIKHRQKLNKTLMTHIAVPIIMLVATSITIKPYFHERYLSLFTPFFVLQLSDLLQKSNIKKTFLPVVMIAIVASNMVVLTESIQPSLLRQANKYIQNGTVLHHSTFTYYPSKQYGPEAKHYLSKNNYTTQTPLLYPEEVIQPNKTQFFDYELQEQGKPHQNISTEYTKNFQNLILIKYKKK